MTLKESLMTIKDFRIDRCKKHNLCDILMIVLIGYLTGCKDMEEIHFNAEVSEEMLRKNLELPNGIPSTDTILRVLAGIDGKELEKVLADYARETFGSRIPEKADYLFSLKGNQEKLHEDVKDFFNHELDEKYCERYKIQKLSCAVEKDHGRIEKRDYYLCTNLKWIAEKDEWKNLCGIGMVRSSRLTKDGESTELRYFITSLTDVNLAAKAMRAHWSIENNLYWVLDTVFDEDYCRVRKDNSAQNLNIIRKLVMNLLKGLDLPVATKKKNLTIGNKQTLCLKNEKCLLYALQNL